MYRARTSILVVLSVTFLPAEMTPPSLTSRMGTRELLLRCALQTQTIRHPVRF